MHAHDAVLFKIMDRDAARPPGDLKIKTPLRLADYRGWRQVSRLLPMPRIRQDDPYAKDGAASGRTVVLAIPSSRVRFSKSALTATRAELPDMAIAATSGLMVKG